MKRSPALVLAAAGVVAPLLWASPAAAEGGYPPTGPTGGGGSVTTTGGSVAPTFGGGQVTTLPHTGTDLQTPALAAGASIATGVALLVVYRRRRPAARP